MLQPFLHHLGGASMLLVLPSVLLGWWVRLPLLALAAWAAVRLIRLGFADADLELLGRGPLPPDAFKDKVVWLVGASQGIGEELARQFAAAGAQLILSSRREAELRRVAAQCRGRHAPGSIVILPLDLTSGQAALAAVAATADAAFGGAGIDLLVHNAAYPRPKVPTEELSEDVAQATMDVNIIGVMTLTRAVLPSMLRRRKGRFIAVSSAAGVLPSPLQSAYAASKHALCGFFRSLRYEVAHRGLSVTIVVPGPIHTDPPPATPSSSTPPGTLSSRLDGSVGGIAKPGTVAGVRGDGNESVGGSDTGGWEGSGGGPKGRQTEEARMSVGRCTELILAAAGHGVDEAWISPHPILAFLYLYTYLPFLADPVLKKVGASRVRRFREGGRDKYTFGALLGFSKVQKGAGEAKKAA